MAPEICPNCGAEVPPDAKACPECGADEATGWSERAAVQRLGVPDPEFDYEEFVSRELEGSEARRSSPHWLWALVAVGLLVLLLILWMLG